MDCGTLNTFFRNKWDGPGENVHEIRKQVGMSGIIILLDIQGIILQLFTIQKYFEFDDGAFVIIHVTVIRRAEDGDDNREVATPVPPVHLITLQLSFMGPDDGNQTIPREKLVSCFIAKEPAASSYFILLPPAVKIPLILFDGVAPK